MSVIKAKFKVYNGTDWDEYDFGSGSGSGSAPTWNNIQVDASKVLVPDKHSSDEEWQSEGIIKTRAYGAEIRLQYNYSEAYPDWSGAYDAKIVLFPAYYGPGISFIDGDNYAGYPEFHAASFNFLGDANGSSPCDIYVNGYTASTYVHHVHIWSNTSTRYSISLTIFTSSNYKEPITTFAKLREAIYYGKANWTGYHNVLSRSVSAHGFYSSYTNIVTGLYSASASSGNITIRYQPYNGSETSVGMSAFTNIQDSVDQILGGF